MDGVPKIVVTYTTLPDRYDTLHRSINSILGQTRRADVIYLTIPKVCRRLNKVYTKLPKEITDSCTVVESDIDYGPITKIYGALVSESDPETIIISCDDDTIYDPVFIESLVKHADKYRDIAICGTGALISKGVYLTAIRTTLKNFTWVNRIVGLDVDQHSGRNVDLIFGVAGVLYRRKFFPEREELENELFDISLKDDALFHNDDVVISGYLSKQGIVRKVFHDIPPIVGDSSPNDALSGNIPVMLSRMQLAIDRAKTYGLYPQMEPLSVSETVPGRVLFLAFLLIAICFLVAALYITL